MIFAKFFNIKLNFYILVACLSVSMVASADSPASVQIKSAIIFVPLGKAKTTQALLSIKNNGRDPVTLIKVTSPYAKKILLFPLVDQTKQTTVLANPWVIAQGQSIEMKSDKIYLAFDGIKYQISTGDDVEITLWFSDGKKLTVMAKAKSAYDLKHSE